jgi:hypothetical protein
VEARDKSCISDGIPILPPAECHSLGLGRAFRDVGADAEFIEEAGGVGGDLDSCADLGSESTNIRLF